MPDTLALGAVVTLPLLGPAARTSSSPSRLSFKQRDKLALGAAIALPEVGDRSRYSMQRAG